MCGVLVFRGSKKTAIEAAMILYFVAGVREHCCSMLTGETSWLKLPQMGGWDATGGREETP